MIGRFRFARHALDPFCSRQRPSRAQQSTLLMGINPAVGSGCNHCMAHGTCKYQVSPHLLDRWRGEWRAKGDLAFPGIGRRGVSLPAVDDARRIGELERKIGQLTMENDFLKKALQ